jgi:hypothetical protein
MYSKADILVASNKVKPLNSGALLAPANLGPCYLDSPSGSDSEQVRPAAGRVRVTFLNRRHRRRLFPKLRSCSSRETNWPVLTLVAWDLLKKARSEILGRTANSP